MCWLNTVGQTEQKLLYPSRGVLRNARDWDGRADQGISSIPVDDDGNSDNPGGSFADSFTENRITVTDDVPMVDSETLNDTVVYETDLSDSD